MSNDSTIARVFKLWAKISMMILDGKRDATTVADALQAILNEQSARKWREEDGVIYFSVISDGTSGVDWITRLESKGFRVTGLAKDALCSSAFKPTNGVVTEVAVLKGGPCEDKSRTPWSFRAEADRRKLIAPNAELACLVREKFADEELKAMGLTFICAMHQPINIYHDGCPRLLDVSRYGPGRELNATDAEPFGGLWNRDVGCAFVVPKTQG